MRIPIVALSAALLAAPAFATTDEEAAALCRAELTGPLGADGTGDITVRRHDGAPWVYGVAAFPDATAVRFRCQVYQDAVRHVMYLVRDPQKAGGRGWSSERPGGSDHDPDLALDDAATAAPKAPLAMPKFETVE